MQYYVGILPLVANHAIQLAYASESKIVYDNVLSILINLQHQNGTIIFLEIEPAA